MPARPALSARAARRIALAAQGFNDPRPSGRLDRRHLRRLLRRVGLLQLDSVNVAVRAHYMPAYSRLGPYDREALDRWAWGSGEMFEYWGHEASLLPVDFHPLLRWRMDRARQGHAWGGQVGVARRRPDFVARVLAEVAARGPLRAADIDDGPRVRSGAMWDWSDTKKALEWLFWIGDVAVGTRVNFERRYDLPERVLPAQVLAAPTPTEEEAHRRLLLLAARWHGIGTARDLADYLRLKLPQSRPRLAELVEDGSLEMVSAEGWDEPAYLHPDAPLPRRIRARALLSPFDPVVWERSRAERLFGFHYRIEIYVPAPQRRWGYYVFPFLLDDRLVARVDLKADRAAGTLRVPGAFLEPGADAREVAEALSGELWSMAAWLGLERVSVGSRGDLAGTLTGALAAGG